MKEKKNNFSFKKNNKYELKRKNLSNLDSFFKENEEKIKNDMKKQNIFNFKKMSELAFDNSDDKEYQKILDKKDIINQNEKEIKKENDLFGYYNYNKLDMHHKIKYVNDIGEKNNINIKKIIITKKIKKKI